jgi:mono/diheme cytochrome c family protein
VRRVAVLLVLAAATASARAATPDLGTDAQRAAGKKLYEKFCAQCHGEKGDGEGVAAAHLMPLPRNFTTGKFKIRTTPSGALPTTQDLEHVIRAGMPYSSMPAWTDFSDDEVKSLAYFVKSFSPDFAKPEFNVDPVKLPKAPAYSKESAEKGRKVYEDTGCISCHGDLGRGDGTSAPSLTDDLGNAIRPADFTQRWTFRGGPTREDIFRTMTTGLNGTPMPAFGDALTEAERWAITDYVYSLGDGDEPHYANLVVAHHVDEPVDPAKGAAAFEGAKTARFAVVGQIMEPTREFHPPVVSLRVQAVYDADSVAFCLRWDDMSAESTGMNGPALPVPAAEEEGPAGAGSTSTSPAEGGGDVWGDASAPAAAPAPKAASDDVWGEAAPAAATSAGAFSDAVAIQLPLQLPAGARKPYFLFGDDADAVDLWFVDLAKGSARQYVAKGSSSVTAADATEVTSAAHYDNGEWTVVIKRPLRASSGVAFEPGTFVPVAFSVWDGHSRERGSKRGLTLWYSVYVEPQQAASVAGPMLRAGLSVLALEVLIVFFVRRRRAKQLPAAAAS